MLREGIKKKIQLVKRLKKIKRMRMKFDIKIKLNQMIGKNQ